MITNYKRLEQMDRTMKPLVFWEGFPPCGLLLNDLSKRVNGDLIVYATKPSVPFELLSKYTEFDIKYVKNTSEILDDWDMIKTRNCFVFTGWTHKSLLELSVIFKRYNKEVVCIMAVDNRLRFTIRQIIGSVYFRLFLKNKIDFVFVPGVSSINLMKFFGMKKNKIFTGYYGAYTKIYNNRTSFSKRENYFIFVGALNKEKSFDILLESYRRYKKKGGTWGLRVVGDGPFKKMINLDQVDFKGFLQPFQTSELMNLSKVLILPSRIDSWGTVVCEAAACGNLLIVSKNAGASYDMVKEGVNGKIINKINAQKLTKAMFWCQHLNNDKAEIGHKLSLSIASNYTEKSYANAVERMFYS